MFTTTNKANLLNLALACPITKGSIVYDARAVYYALYPTDYRVFNDNCDGVALYKKDPNELTAKVDFDATLYPNPTNNLVYINTNLVADNEITITVTDIAGKELIKQTCKTNNNHCAINLMPNSAGVYIFKIVNNSTNETIIKKVVLE